MEKGKVGMIILTGKAPTLPGVSPKDKSVAICADLIALVERAMLDPSKDPRVKQQVGRTNVSSLPQARPEEVTIVHLMGGQTLVVEETSSQVLALRERAMTGGIWSLVGGVPVSGAQAS